MGNPLYKMSIRFDLQLRLQKPKQNKNIYLIFR